MFNTLTFLIIQQQKMCLFPNGSKSSRDLYEETKYMMIWFIFGLIMIVFLSIIVSIETQNINFFMDHSTFEFTKIGTDKVVLRIDYESKVNRLFGIQCNNIDQQIRIYKRNIVEIYQGNHSTNIVINGLNDSTHYSCYLHREGSIHPIRNLSEFSTLKKPDVEMYIFRLYQGGVGVVTGSVYATPANGYMYWFEYGTPTNHFQFTTEKKEIVFASNSETVQSVELKDQMKMPNYDFYNTGKARLVVMDPVGNKFTSASITGIVF